MKAVVVGGTGATGRPMISELVKSSAFTSVVSLGRRVLPPETFLGPDQQDTAQSSKLQQQTIDFDKPETIKPHMAGAETCFCLLGTTRKVAGSAEAFVKVDHDYVMAVAKEAKAAGVRHFSIVTAVGSDPKSMFLYPKTKGQVEEELKAMQFPRLTILRPNLLITGERDQKRSGEGIAQKFFSAMPTCMLPSALIPIKVEAVARAMLLDAAWRPGHLMQPSVEVLESKEIQRIADKGSRD